MRIYLFVLTSVVLSSLAQITLKSGMSTSGVQRVLDGASTLDLVAAVSRTPAIFFGLFLYVLSVVFWLWVLARIEVSQAYPFVGLGFLITMAFGCLVLGETFTAQKIAGTLMVAFGVFLVASSA